MIRWLWAFFTPPTSAQDVRQRSAHAHRVLVFARELIADRRRWTTGVEARNKDGYETQPHSPAAECFCAAGAINACASTEEARKEATAALAKVMRERHEFPDWWCPFMVVSRVNDTRGHKVALEAFDEAIRRVV